MRLFQVYALVYFLLLLHPCDYRVAILQLRTSRLWTIRASSSHHVLRRLHYSYSSISWGATPQIALALIAENWVFPAKSKEKRSATKEHREQRRGVDILSWRDNPKLYLRPARSVAVS